MPVQKKSGNLLNAPRICLSSTLSTIFMACSSSCTPLYDPQLITLSFPLKIGTITLVFHSSGIPLPY